MADREQAWGDLKSRRKALLDKGSRSLSEEKELDKVEDALDDLRKSTNKNTDAKKSNNNS